MKDRQARPTAARHPILRSLWHRSRTEARDETEASRSITVPVENAAPPLRQALRRFALAVLVLALTTLVVWLDRDGYNDNSGSPVNLLDAAYYATVTLSTTGYGDITPVSDSARLTNIFVITPLRVLFLIILVGTTLEVLTERTRQEVRIHRWRAQIRDHVVVVGYGTKGRKAIETLLGQGIAKEKIVIVDSQHETARAAGDDGLVSVVGDATRSETLRKASVQNASKVIIAPHRDETATLITLTARQLTKRATIVASIREDENVPLLKQSGADAVITSSSAAGRLLGVSVVSPAAARTLEDLMTQGSGLDLTERPVSQDEVGQSPRECADPVVAVVRDKKVLDYTDPWLGKLKLGDRLITISRATYPS
ncbi:MULTISPECIES: potassium channel family protein [Streptomyces]|uniref:potassium channel family protein n=1 Tax=Streptomyces TaxID=1883 RepID=UPI001C2F474E|nr:potassium channel family protein [Streptomyces sp. GbtcB7]